jgi:uncharacterized protein involved in exopolysaccharide biosynthesis
MTRHLAVRLTAVLFFSVVFSGVSVYAQAPRNTKPAVVQADESAVRSSPAFAELLLRKTELESELEGLILDYTEEFPRVVALRAELALINKELERVLAVRPAEAGKLTLALGKLLVKKVELDTQLSALLKSYKEEHPDVRRAKRRLEIYEKAVNEILGK